MKIINLFLLFLPVLGYSQVDSIIVGDNMLVGDKMFIRKRPELVLYKLQPDTLPTGGITTQSLEYYNSSAWSLPKYSTETVKGKEKSYIRSEFSTSFQVHVEIYETRDTLYKCPISNFTYFNASGLVEKSKGIEGCTLDKVVTCRTYRFYIINEKGKKEYLSMDISKNK